MGKNSSMPKSWFIKKQPGAPSVTILFIFSVSSSFSLSSSTFEIIALSSDS